MGLRLCLKELFVNSKFFLNSIETINKSDRLFPAFLYIFWHTSDRLYNYSY